MRKIDCENCDHMDCYGCPELDYQIQRSNVIAYTPKEYVIWIDEQGSYWYKDAYDEQVHRLLLVATRLRDLTPVQLSYDIMVPDAYEYTKMWFFQFRP
jgi:hypothetical protein